MGANGARRDYDREECPVQHKIRLSPWEHRRLNETAEKGLKGVGACIRDIRCSTGTYTIRLT